MNPSNPDRMANFENVANRSVEDLKKEGWVFNQDETWGMKLDVKDDKSGKRIAVVRDTYGQARVYKNQVLAPQMNISENRRGEENFSLSGQVPNDPEIQQMITEALTWNPQGKPEQVYAAIQNTEESDKNPYRLVETRTNEKLFDDVLAGNIDAVPGGHLTSSPKLASLGVKSVIATPFVDPAPGNDHFLTVVLNQEKGALTFRIDENGKIVTPWPKNSGISENEAYREILQIIEKVGSKFWHQVDDDILMQTDPDEREYGNQEDSLLEPPPIANRPERTRNLDRDTERDEHRTSRRRFRRKSVEALEGENANPERIKLLESHPRALFGVLNQNAGFDGYHIFVFDRFIVFENPLIGNAAFFKELDEPIEVPAEVYDIEPNTRLTPDQKRESYQRSIKPILNRATTKGGLLAIGAKRIIHETEESGAEAILKEIEKRLA